jgi:hypothetical protein
MELFTVVLVEAGGDYPDGIGYIEPEIHTCLVEAENEAHAVEVAKEMAKPYETPIVAGVFLGHIDNRWESAA